MLNKTVVVLFVFCLLIGIAFSYFNSVLELLFLDIKFWMTNSRYSSYEFSPYLVLITIDQASEVKLNLALEGKGWRQYDALLIDFLREQGAAVITSDIQYSHETTPWDKALAASIKRAGRVITSEDTDGITSPLIRESVYALASPSITTLHGVPRKVYKYRDRFASGTYNLSFAAVAAYAQFLLADEVTAAEGRRLQQRLEKLDSFWINYGPPVIYLPHFSYADVLEARETGSIGPGEVPVSIFKKKIILIAKDFPKDRFPIPNANGKLYFGGMVHGFGMETLLSGTYLVPVSLFWHILVVCLTLFCIQFFCLRLPSAVRIFALPTPLILVWGISYFLLQSGNFWLNYAGVFTGSSLLILFNFIYQRRLLIKNYRLVKSEISRLEKYNHLLEEAAQMRDILTDTIVHDIKNSIAAVEGSLLYVTEKYKNDEYTLQTFHAANVACQDIINLSSNLLDVRKMEEGEMEFENCACSPREILEIVRRFGQYPLFFEKKIALEIREPEFETLFSADRYLLEQIIHNLLNNALKYSPQAGEIRVFFSRQEGQLIISFYNTGRPITENQQQIIFEKYIRLGKGRSKYSKGLGLYFCKMAMEMQEGRIWITTDAEGNCFHLAFKEVDGLPVSDPEHQGLRAE